ncbi:hypothetical protein Landi51_13906 [Colletotrichum acutatum]
MKLEVLPAALPMLTTKAENKEARARRNARATTASPAAKTPAPCATPASATSARATPAAAPAAALTAEGAAFFTMEEARAISEHYQALASLYAAAAARY